MNRSLAIAATLLGLSAVSLSIAQTASPAADVGAAVNPAQAAVLSASDNAALAYYKVWVNPLPASLYVDNKTKTDADWRPSPELVQLLKDNQWYVNGMIEASQKERADFGIDLAGRGFLGALLPHLGNIRNSARCLACDARRCIAEGKKDEAAERIVVIYRMARHITDVDVLCITSLVSVSLCQIADSQVDLLISTGNLSAHGKEILLIESRKLAEPDAFGIKKSIENERDSFRKTFLNLKGNDAGQQFVKMTHGWYGSTLEQEQVIARFNEADMAASIEQAAQAYTAVIRSWDATNAQQLSKEIDTRVQAGEYGPLAKYFVPANCNLKRTEQKVKLEHDRILNLLTNSPVSHKLSQ